MPTAAAPTASSATGHSSTYHDRFRNQSTATFRLDPGLGTHTGPRRRAAKHLIGKRVLRWSTVTTGMAWYDVERYTVRFTYYVLR